MKHLKKFKMFEEIDSISPEWHDEKNELSDETTEFPDETINNDEPLDIPSTPESNAKSELAEELKVFLNALLAKHGFSSFDECEKGSPECAAFEEDAKKGWIKEVGPTPYGKEIIAEFGE